MSISLAIGTSEACDMLHAKVSSVIVLLDGALITENEANMPTVITLKGVGLNLIALPREVLYLFPNPVISKLRACEHCTL